jgi:hypothetical protein
MYPLRIEQGVPCGMIALADLDRCKARSLSSRDFRRAFRSH